MFRSFGDGGISCGLVVFGVWYGSVIYRIVFES